MTESPTVGQWQLAQELRRLRAGRTRSEVGKTVQVSGATVSRWETAGHLGSVPGPGALTRLIDFYGLSEMEAQRLRKLREQARRRSWWQSYELEGQYETLIGLESEASRILTYESQLVPGLLQTEGYASAIIKATRPEIAKEQVDALVQVRMARQEAWLKASDTRLWAIVWEAAFRQLSGGATVMKEQLRYLLELSEHPRVTLQALSFTVGGHAAQDTSAFQILYLEEAQLSTVYLETRKTSLFLDEPTDVEDYADVFNLLRADAAGKSATQAILSEIARAI